MNVWKEQEEYIQCHALSLNLGSNQPTNVGSKKGCVQKQFCLDTSFGWKKVFGDNKCELKKVVVDKMLLKVFWLNLFFGLNNVFWKQT